MINKKGQTLQGWSEGIIFVLLFVIVFGVVVFEMNKLYSEDHDIAGLDTGGIEDALEGYQEGMEEKYRTGEASVIEQGWIIIKSGWDIIFSTMRLIWFFVGGGWIETICTDYMKLPDVVAPILRIMYFLSVGFIVLRVLFKVKA